MAKVKAGAVGLTAGQKTAVGIATEFSRRAVALAINHLHDIFHDPKHEERQRLQFCRFCYYIVERTGVAEDPPNSILDDAVHYNCQLCKAGRLRAADSIEDPICLECALAHTLCIGCMAELNAVPRELSRFSFHEEP